jgi:hypothetical protein
MRYWLLLLLSLLLVSLLLLSLPLRLLLLSLSLTLLMWLALGHTACVTLCIKQIQICYGEGEYAVSRSDPRQ